MGKNQPTSVGEKQQATVVTPKADKKTREIE